MFAKHRRISWAMKLILFLLSLSAGIYAVDTTVRWMNDATAVMERATER